MKFLEFERDKSGILKSFLEFIETFEICVIQMFSVILIFVKTTMNPIILLIHIKNPFELVKPIAPLKILCSKAIFSLYVYDRRNQRGMNAPLLTFFQILSTLGTFVQFQCGGNCLPPNSL